MQSRSRARSVVRFSTLVAGYLGLIVWLTWPLGRSPWSSMPGTRAPCWFDMYYSAWVLSHESRALVTDPLHIVDANIYYPATDVLFYGPAALGALPLFAPAFLATGNPAFALNVTFLLGLALTGAAMHEVVQRWTGSDLAGVVAACTVLMNDWVIRSFVPTAPHWAALFCFPVIAFMVATRLDSFRSALWLVPLLVWQSLVDVVYVAPAVLGPLFVLGAGLFLRRRTRPAALRLVAVLGLAGVSLLPVLLGYWRVQAANPDLAHQTSWPMRGLLHLASDLTVNFPAVPFTVPHDLFAGVRPLLLTPAGMVVVPLGIAAAAWLRRRGRSLPVPGGWTQGVLWAAVGLLLSLNPKVIVAGRQFSSPLDYATAWLPSLQAIRVPERLGIAGLIGLGILSGIAFGEIAMFLHVQCRRRSVSTAISTVLGALTVAFLYGACRGSYWPLLGTAPRKMACHVQELPQIPTSFVPILSSSRVPLIEVPLADGLLSVPAQGSPFSIRSCTVIRS